MPQTPTSQLFDAVRWASESEEFGRQQGCRQALAEAGACRGVANRRPGHARCHRGQPSFSCKLEPPLGAIIVYEALLNFLADPPSWFEPMLLVSGSLLGLWLVRVLSRRRRRRSPKGFVDWGAIEDDRVSRTLEKLEAERLQAAARGEPSVDRFADLDAIDHKYAREGAARAIKILRERGVMDGGRPSPQRSKRSVGRRPWIAVARRGR